MPRTDGLAYIARDHLGGVVPGGTGYSSLNYLVKLPIDAITR